MSGATYDLIRDLLDHELVDSDNVSCGMVDDVEIDIEHGNVTALLTGGRVWTQRLPALLRVLLPSLGATGRTRIPFEQVDEISEVIGLKSRATELGLGVDDRRAGRLLARMAGSS